MDRGPSEYCPGCTWFTNNVVNLQGLASGGVAWVPMEHTLCHGVNTQNSWPSGSAITTQLTSPWPTSMRVAPRETRRSTSAC